MFRIFLDKQTDIQYSKIKFSEFDYIKRVYKKDLDLVKKYYRNKNGFVNNNNKLVRLINNLVPNVGLNILDYLSIIETNARLVSKQYDITSNINRGSLDNNIILKDNSIEGFLYTEGDYDIFDFKNIWLDYNSVKVIRTDICDLSMNHPSNIEPYLLEELTLYSIDIVAMLLQYKYWCEKRLLDGNSINASIFVYQIVYTNLIDSFLDYGVYNTLLEQLKIKDVFKLESEHPFYITNQSDKIVSYVNKLIKALYNRNIKITELMININLINSNLFDLLHIEHTYYTVQSEWMLWLSRTNDIYNMLYMLSKNGNKRNRDMLSRVKLSLRRIRQTNSLESSIDNILIYEDLKETLKKIKKYV